MQGAGDVLLVPRPETWRALPWSGHSAWIFCTPVYPDGRPIPFAPCAVLQRQVEMPWPEQGMAATFGLEVEFHLFELADNSAAHAQSTRPGAPVQTRNLTQGYQYLTETRYGEAEGILDLLRRNAQKLGLPVRSVEIEMGPSQVEFTFAPDGAMAQADAMVMFRTMVKEVCARNGLHASFMAKPRLDNAMANGWHVHQSLQDLATGRNLFMPETAGMLSPPASAWMAGLLKYASETSLLIAPTVNSYKRYLPFQLAPSRIGWGEDNRGAMLRALMQSPRPRQPDREPRPRQHRQPLLRAGRPGHRRCCRHPGGAGGPEDPPCRPTAKTLTACRARWARRWTGSQTPRFAARRWAPDTAGLPAAAQDFRVGTLPRYRQRMGAGGVFQPVLSRRGTAERRAKFSSLRVNLPS